MDNRISFILMEFEYEHTYLYEYCNRIKKSLCNNFLKFDEDSDINSALRFTDEDEKKIIRVLPTRSGVFFNLDDWGEDYNIENIIKEITSDFSKVFSDIRSILQLDTCNIETSIALGYEVEKTNDQFKNKLLSSFLCSKNKNIKDVEITLDNDGEDGKRSLRISNEEDIIKIININYYDKITELGLKEEILGIKKECDEIINEILK